MSRPQTPEPARPTQEDSPTGTGGEDTGDGIQHSHRMLSFSDALLSIIATVMVRVPPEPSPPFLLATPSQGRLLVELGPA